jgi:hypothetical protein
MMFRMPGLDQDTSRSFSPTRSSSDLGNQLKGPLTRPEVRKVQSSISVQHPNQSDTWEVMTLGNHLSSHKNVDITPPKSIQNSSMTRPRPSGVSIHSVDTNLRPQGTHLFFDALGSSTHKVQSIGALAGRAG